MSNENENSNNQPDSSTVDNHDDIKVFTTEDIKNHVIGIITETEPELLNVPNISEKIDVHSVKLIGNFSAVTVDLRKAVIYVPKSLRTISVRLMQYSFSLYDGYPIREELDDNRHIDLSLSVHTNINDKYISIIDPARIMLDMLSLYRTSCYIMIRNIEKICGGEYRYTVQVKRPAYKRPIVYSFGK